VELIRNLLRYRKTRARKKLGFLQSLWEKRGEPREEENQEKGGLEIL